MPGNITDAVIVRRVKELTTALLIATTY